jgi:hypothetical protein
MKRWAPAAAAAAVVAAVVVAVVLLRPEPTGRATGERPSKEALALWETLARYEQPYLATWDERFAGQPADALEVLAGFNELASGVTGFGGLWRKTVPNDYFGCVADPETPICQRLAAATKNFERFDALQQAILDLETDRDAQKFLAKNAALLREYLDTYVPADRSFSAIQATPFFAQNLASALP